MSSQSYPSLFGAWAEASTRVFNQMMEANRAAMSAFSPPKGDDGDAEVGAPVEDRIEPASDLPEWDAELTTTDYGEFGVGDHVRFTKTISEEDITRFAAASGDTNPVHLDETWAEQTRFEGRIVHGTLASGLISAALARLPGGVIYLSQDVEFQAPVRIGDRLTAEVEVVEDLGGNRFRLRTVVERGRDGTQVIDGEAVILIVDTSHIETDD
jgi:acyl dehydratase